MQSNFLLEISFITKVIVRIVLWWSDAMIYLILFSYENFRCAINYNLVGSQFSPCRRKLTPPQLQLGIKGDAIVENQVA